MREVVKTLAAANEDLTICDTMGNSGEMAKLFQG